jgi:hypothetical protein
MVEELAMRRNVLRAAAVVMVVAVLQGVGFGADWGEVQGIKKELLGTAAKHAMEQQKRTGAEAVGVAFPEKVVVGGELHLERTGKSLK